MKVKRRIKRWTGEESTWITIPWITQISLSFINFINLNNLNIVSNEPLSNSSLDEWIVEWGSALLLVLFLYVCKASTVLLHRVMIFSLRNLSEPKSINSVNVYKLWYRIQKWATRNLNGSVNNHEKNEERNNIEDKCSNITYTKNIISSINNKKEENILVKHLIIMSKKISQKINKTFNFKGNTRFYFLGGGLGRIRTFHIKPFCLITNEKILSIMILLLLLCQGVESNPGPPGTLEFLTYNCNGLGDQKKLRRLLNKLDKKVNRGAIILLQETHIVNTSNLSSMWKHKYLSNCKRTNAAGVMILFSGKYEVRQELYDNDGRHILAVLSYEEKNIIISNAYFPNDHKEGIKFAEEVYCKVLEAQSDFPDNLTVCAGDYNTCLTTEDSFGRVGSQNEKLLAEVIQNNNEITALGDAYRTIHKKEGFTWNRGGIYSRLDYIFISRCALQLVVEAKTDWAFESSDHAAVSVNINNNEIKKGPGIVKVNANIMDDPKITEEIAKELQEMMRQTDDSWNPHASLEFLKVSIRTILAEKVSERRKQTRDAISEKEEEQNQMEDIKIKLLIKQNIPKEQMSERTNNINRAIENLKSSIQILRKEMDDKMTFYSRAKWFEYGEKSNKFFLNLNKSKQNQKLISKIKDGEKEYFGHEQTSKGITNFYRNLYAYKPRESDARDEGFYDNSPKLTEDNKEFMEKEINLNDLKESLATCSDSAPGPDGIPYSVYKKLWFIAGPIILKAWQHSLEVGRLPPSHLESVITLLPKEGKDTSDIKNWRPITLSNCDAKIITKAIAIKISKVLESIIDVSQTAYVPGRSITDNLRANAFYKNYCKKNNVDAVLVSLDAKKAFDSVNHNYIAETLKAYGFGDNFLKVFRTLYNDITARIMVNGFASEKIKIERGVKQGDALSCALFILCIDPVIRNINENKNIKQVKITSGRSIRKKINLKAAAYADDISVICEKDRCSIQTVFDEYEKLTRLSGLELNADKTEILILNKETSETMTITYNDQIINIASVPKLKICGIYFCVDDREEYNLNVITKIEKLCYKIKSWIPRHLTMEGKSLIVKTFGISQIIYNMQACSFDDKELVTIERIIFKFLWSTNENHDGIDRIKRSIMKNDYEHGGMKITDMESLNRSLKLRQFIRAKNSTHVISRIQNWLTNGNESCQSTRQEYSKITSEEPICKSAQESLNLITDYNREQYEKMEDEDTETNKHLINEISSIDLLEYLKRKNSLLMICLLKTLTMNGITTLGELVQNHEFEMDSKILKVTKIIMSIFPKKFISISKCYIEGINDISENLKVIRTYENMWKDINNITVKEMQSMMKVILKKTEITNFEQKLGIDNFQENAITKFRSKCQNAKFRNLFFRLIHNDFFTHVRMYKYKMCQSDLCPRCGITETTRHLLMECRHAKNIWNLYNLVTKGDKVNKYEDLFSIGDSQCEIMIKMKIIQELIQIDRPKNWVREKIVNLIKNLMDIEKYNAIKNRKILKFNKIWNKYENLEIT